MARLSSKAIEPLPRGRHSLPPEVVVDSQRERALAAMIDVVAEKGYSDASIADVIAAAGISRKTFYELFADKEDCFLVAYDQALNTLSEALSEGYDADHDAPWIERVRAALANYLDRLAADPALARVCVIEVLGAGPKALARRDAAIRQMALMIDVGRAESDAELPGLASLALVGGINELLYTETLHGATTQLPSRLPELIYWVAHPFLGEERAQRERDAAREWMREREGGPSS